MVDAGINKNKITKSLTAASKDAGINSGWGARRRFGSNFLFALAIGLVTWRLWIRREMNLQSILAGSVHSALTTTVNVTRLAAATNHMTAHNNRTAVAESSKAITETIAGSNETETTTDTTEAPNGEATTNETTDIVSAIESPPTSPPQQEPSGPMARNVHGVRSVFTYTACCGLGHRLARQAGAYMASHRLGFQLQVNWLNCGDREIFSAMFRPETEEELATYAHSLNQSYQTSNEVSGTYHSAKNCVPDEMESNYNFYNELKRRFLGHDKVDKFVQEHFQNKFSLGIHIRDGNGEQGDFAQKRRQIKVAPEEWTQRVAKKIVSIVEQAKNHTRDLPPPVLFIASDNAKYIGLFQTQLQEEGIPVVHWEQDLESEGVFMGQGMKQGYDTEQCLQKWMDMLLDMILLSSTDVVIAGQYSSFSQTMPMQLALGKPQEQRKVEKTFCEVLNEGTDMQCHRDQMDWCMHTKYKNAVKTFIPPWVKNNATGWTDFLAKMPTDARYRNFTNHMRSR
jgi:hypothetical protein